MFLLWKPTVSFSATSLSYSRLTIYTPDTLEKLNKQDLIEVAITLQTETEPSKEFLEGLKALSAKFEEIESDVVISKNVNTLIYSWLVALEKQCWEYLQYSKRENLEVTGLPTPLLNVEVEAEVWFSFQTRM